MKHVSTRYSFLVIASLCPIVSLANQNNPDLDEAYASLTTQVEKDYIERTWAAEQSRMGNQRQREPIHKVRGIFNHRKENNEKMKETVGFRETLDQATLFYVLKQIEEKKRSKLRAQQENQEISFDEPSLAEQIAMVRVHQGKFQDKWDVLAATKEYFVSGKVVEHAVVAAVGATTFFVVAKFTSNK